ncbi:hypothetical protein V5O48_014786 [Marasmius crinis-equi]|uniref:Uncharacterized protein n=1 Tax=Marasmius crinis-equi TaxID=585013 RepID=A0ABR3EWD2_9AGAR
MANNLTAEDLLKYQSTTAPITFSDGITAVIDSQSRTFITSPNQMQIPRPPIGSTCDLYRRNDGFYSQDNPVQHPQPFSRKYCYFVCMPAVPEFETDPYYSDFCMWKTRYQSRDFNNEGGQSSALRDLSKSIETLRQREKNFLQSQPKWQTFFSELNITIDLCIHRLSAPTVSSRIVLLAVSEIQ